MSSAGFFHPSMINQGKASDLCLWQDAKDKASRLCLWVLSPKCDIVVVVVVVIYLIYQGQGITPLPLAGFLHPAMMHSRKLPRCPP